MALLSSIVQTVLESVVSDTITGMLKNIVFDFDGVIADSFDVNFALSREHDPAFTHEDFLAHHDGNVFAEPRIKFIKDRLPEFFTKYQEKVTRSHLERAIPFLLEFGKRYKLYIISSMSEGVIEHVLKAADLQNLFVRIMGEETHQSKAEKFKMLIAEGKIAVEDTVFITDTLGDVKEGSKVGIRTIAETFGFHDRERLAQGEPFRIVDSWDEIDQVIKELDAT